MKTTVLLAFSAIAEPFRSQRYRRRHTTAKRSCAYAPAKASRPALHRCGTVSKIRRIHYEDIAGGATISSMAIEDRD
ncbi:MAG: hypothetical protein ACLQL2_11050 [Methylovirgula sp.]